METAGSSPRNIQASDFFPCERKRCLLFYCPEMEALARKIAESKTEIELGEISWDRFEDGFPNIFIQNAVHIRNRHVGFLASFHSSEAIFEQISVIYALPRLFLGSFTLVLPFFPTGTHERVISFKKSLLVNLIDRIRRRSCNSIHNGTHSIQYSAFTRRTYEFSHL